MDNMKSSPPWLALILSLQTAQPKLRMRLWRALKALGCATLRDGVYMLPADGRRESALQQLAEEIRREDGSAYVLRMETTTPAEHEECRRQFDRSADYAALCQEIEEFQASLAGLEAAAMRRQLRHLQRGLEQLGAIDFFPGEALQQTAARLATAQAAAQALFAPGEPNPASQEIPRLRREDYQGRRWATRQRPWVDRLACAWLIRRFIDPQARMLWLEKPEDCPPDALGFDFDGAAFSHSGHRVSFETLLAAFGLETDAALQRIGNLAHFLDVGGLPAPEAAGLESLLRGMRLKSVNDDELSAAAALVFDGLYADFGNHAY
jgi:hypothetical protein